MNNKQGQNCINSLVQRNMESTMGTAVLSGLPQANGLLHYSHDKFSPSRSCFSYSFSGQEECSSHWSPAKTYMRNGPNPDISSLTSEGPVPAVCRPNKIPYSVEPGGSPYAVPQELAIRQRLAYYINSPRHHCPRPERVPLHNTLMGCSDPENFAGLAIPKPVYGLGSCCTERGCIAGHSYRMEHGPHGTSPQMYEDEYATHYNHLAFFHKKEQGVLGQHRGFHLGHEMKDVVNEPYHVIGSNEMRKHLPVTESSYDVNTSHPFIDRMAEYYHSAPIPPQMYRGYPRVFEPRTVAHHQVSSKVYEDNSQRVKHPQTAIPQYSNIYYPRSQQEIYRSNSKAITDEPNQHHMSQLHQTELMSPPSSATPSNHLKQPTYPNSVNLNSPLDLLKQLTYQNGVSLNSSSHLLKQQTYNNEVNLKSNPPSPVNQSDNPLDFSVRKVQTPQDFPRLLSRQAEHSIYRTAGNTSSLKQPEVTKNGFLGDASRELPSKRHSDPADKDMLAKRQREKVETDMSKTRGADKVETPSPSSPPMPVINKVFSLAPYKVYFQATGMLTSFVNSKSPNPQPEAAELKLEAEIQNCDVEPNSWESDLDLKQERPTSSGRRDDGADLQESIDIKAEKVDSDDVALQSEMKQPMNKDHNVKEESGECETIVSNCFPCRVVVKSDYEEESEVPLEEELETVVTHKECTPAPTLPSLDVSPVLPLTFSVVNILPNSTSFKMVLPALMKTPALQPAAVPQLLIDPKPVVSSRQHARNWFMELHQSLCKLIHNRVSQTPSDDLNNWICKFNLPDSKKGQKISSLMGVKIREHWLKGEDIKVALQKVVSQLQEYIESCECPFPHVIRAGAVFIPMLVVKELLFPQIQSAFIDQVLQDHRVELRPTTLSEERQLTKLHRKAFSSKLRRLLSLKHLQEIYPDVISLVYHASTCRFLGSPINSTPEHEHTDSCDESSGCLNQVDGIPLKTSGTNTIGELYVKQTPCLNAKKKKGRVKASSRQTFLDESSSSQDDEPPQDQEGEGTLHTNSWKVSSFVINDIREPYVEVTIGEKTQELESEVSAWGRPLTIEDLSSDCTDEDTESTSSSLQSQRSSIILKLRKVFCSKAQRGRVSHYQKVESFTERVCYGKRKQMSSPRKKWPSDKDFSIKDQSYISKKHGSKRLRGLLRSAEQSSPLESRFPNLVGKRIQHLYEEKDKTEVWYRGVVLRIHERNSNPLKTVFEVKYDSEPEWQYYLELLLDYKKGWLKVEE